MLANFDQQVGLSPLRWLNQQRLDRARHLLETTDRSVDQIAEQAGFGTGGSLRLHPQRVVGVSPGDVPGPSARRPRATRTNGV